MSKQLDTTKTPLLKPSQKKASKKTATDKPIVPAAEKVAGKSVTKKSDGTPRSKAAAKAISDAKKLAGASPVETPAVVLAGDGKTPAAEALKQMAAAGIELAANERIYDPRVTGEVSNDTQVRKLVRRNGQALPFPLFVMTAKDEPKNISDVPSRAKSSRKGSAKSATKTATGEKKDWIGNIETSARVLEVRDQINKHTSAKPLIAKKVWGSSQYPNRIARVLARDGFVAMEDREDVGRVYFKK
jgi:hypothetical protein